MPITPAHPGSADLRIMFATEIIQMVAHNFRFQRIRFAEPVQLDQQTFPEIPGPDSHRMERLHHVECLLQFAQRNPRADR